MIKLTDFLETIQEINSINEELGPLEKRRNEKQLYLCNLNQELSHSLSEKKFLAEKLYEEFTEEERSDLERYREYVKSNCEGPSVYYDSVLEKVFDPFYDNWHIYDFEKNPETDEVRFSVSCTKNEGSISGMVTFLDTHYTSWIKISELKMFDDEL